MAPLQGYESEARRKGRCVLFLIPSFTFGTFFGMLEFNLLERQIAPMAKRHAPGRPHTMPSTLPHWDWQAKRGILAGVVRPPLLRMNRCAVKRARRPAPNRRT
jgi:hypothetical protein